MGMEYNSTRPTSANGSGAGQTSDTNNKLGNDSIQIALWIYEQSTGDTVHVDDQTGIGTYEGRGYSGHGDGLNNPDMENTPNVGPIPQGGYDIGPEQTNVTNNGTVLPNSMRLTPDPGVAPGRGGFLFHGGNFTTMDSSTGCPVEPLDVRNQIGNSGDTRLEVIP